jgi:hypothetical protein
MIWERQDPRVFIRVLLRSFPRRQAPEIPNQGALSRQSLGVIIS